MLVLANLNMEKELLPHQVVVKNLFKSFEKGNTRRLILKDISFEIQKSQFVSLLGPSGCGKSTLLKIIGGLLQKDQGEVKIDGVNVDSPQRKIGFMFQKSVLLPWRTVLQNLLLPIELAGLPMKEYRERALELLDMVGLKGYQNYYPKELSGGMQQRVSLARVLMNDPDILLLDEPFGALDEFTRENLNFSLMEIVRKTNKTVILVTHNIGEAVLMSDRIMVLGSNPGHLLEDMEINIPHPRTGKVMELPEYTQYIMKIRKLLGVGRE